MIRIVPDVLDADGVAKLRSILDGADWIDGNETSGPQAALAKRNQQLPEFGEAAGEAGRFVLDALGRSPLFIAAALPLKIYPPYFNRYSGGENFGDHIDNAIRLQWAAAAEGMSMRFSTSDRTGEAAGHAVPGGTVSVLTYAGGPEEARTSDALAMGRLGNGWIAKARRGASWAPFWWPRATGCCSDRSMARRTTRRIGR